MAHLLFAGYLVLFAWLIVSIRFFRKTGLSNSQLIILFLVKVMAGIFYGWIGTYYSSMARMSDTWSYHRLGVLEYKLLFSDPYEYLVNLFHNPYAEGSSGFFASYNSYWNDLKSNVIIKFLSVCDIFSFGYYYVNVVFFAFLTLIGPIALYRVLVDYFGGRRLTIMLAIFLAPSFLYWTSGIHKEGILFSAISMMVFQLYFGWKERRYSLKRWLIILLCLGVLLVLRNFLFALFIPALIAWMIAYRLPRFGFAAFAGVYILFGTLFFTMRYLNPKFDFPAAVVEKQAAFMRLRKSPYTIHVRHLEPDAGSFIRNTPQAIAISFLRPLPGDVQHLMSLAASIEVILYVLLFILFLLCRKKNPPGPRTILYFFLFLSVSIMLAIGFSINNIGAIARYRSVILPLMIVPMAAQTDWRRIAQYFAGKFATKYSTPKA